MARKMKDSGIEWLGSIPADWYIVRLRYLCQVSTGNKDTINKDDDGQYPFYVRSPIVERINSYSYDGEAVLMAGDGVGAGKVFHYANGKFDYHQRVYNIHGFKGVKAKYLYYYLMENFRKEIEQSNAKSTVDSIRLPMLLDFPISVGNQEEQQSIADYLDRKCSLIDSIMEKQKTVIEKLKLYKQSIITEAVTKGLDPNVKMKPSGIEWIGHVPENWVICRIKDVAELNPKFSDSFSFNNNDEVSFCPMECIGQGYMTPTISTIDRVKNGYTFFADGDIVMAKVTPCFENGNIAIADGLTNGIGFGSTELYVFRSKRVNRLLLFYFLQNTIFRERCISSMYGVGGLKRVPLEFINTYHLALPPIKEQRIIAEFLKYRCSQIDATVSIKQNLIDKLTDYKKSLIYECVTGKREVV
jgi:type I restriction enzyme S subunit